MKAKIKKYIIDDFLNLQGMNMTELHELLATNYSFEFGYKAFNKLVNNKVSWKLDYAFALSEIMEVSVNELFEWNKNNNLEVRGG